MTWLLAYICTTTQMKLKTPTRCILKLLFFLMLNLTLPFTETSFQICCCIIYSPHSHHLWKDILSSKWKKKVNLCRKGALVSRTWVCPHRLHKTRVKGSISIRKTLKVWKTTVSSCFQELYCSIWSTHFSPEPVLIRPPAQPLKSLQKSCPHTKMKKWVPRDTLRGSAYLKMNCPPE